VTINWEAVSTISDLIGAIVVVVTLGYVAAQIRQNTNAIVANSRQGMLDADVSLFGDFMSYAIDPHLIGDEVTLTPEDERRFTWIVIKAIRIREFAWHQYKAGNLDEESWQSDMAPVPGIFATKRAQAVLDFYTGSPEFTKVLADRVSAAKPKAA
jgi:hypothetical protein